MKNLLEVLVRERMEKEGLSLRDAAKASGVSHNTIRNILIGEPVDFATIEIVCKWLGVSPAEVMRSEGNDADALGAKIAAVVKSYPKFAAVFDKAMDRLLKGEVDQDTIRDLIAYINYRLGAEQNEKDGE